jgi:hypothetical protein
MTRTLAAALHGQAQQCRCNGKVQGIHHVPVR